MKVGIQLPEVERDIGWEEIRDVAITAEEAGLDSIWVGDHLLYREGGRSKGPWEAWSLLAALAEATNRVDLGPLVAATSFHSPAMLAKKAATVDEISGGRLILGLGAGWNRVEYDAYGFPYDRRVSRFGEAYDIISSLVRVGVVDFEGDFYTLREMELVPPARADMQIMVGSNGPRMLRISAPTVDMWNTWHVWFGNRASGLSPLMREVDRACMEVGRDPTEVGRSAAVYVQLSRGRGREAGSGDRPEAGPITGSAEAIAAELATFEAAGMEHLQIVLDPIDAAAVEELANIVDGMRAR